MKFKTLHFKVTIKATNLNLEMIKVKPLTGTHTYSKTAWISFLNQLRILLHSSQDTFIRLFQNRASVTSKSYIGRTYNFYFPIQMLKFATLMLCILMRYTFRLHMKNTSNFLVYHII